MKLGAAGTELFMFYKFYISSGFFASHFASFSPAVFLHDLFMMICFPRSGSLPAGYTKCDLKAKNGVPRFQVSNQRAWANPTPTPWGRDSEYHVTASSSDHMLTRGRACHQILFQAHNWVLLHVTLMLHTFSVGFIPISDSDIILFKPKHDRHFINR